MKKSALIFVSVFMLTLSVLGQEKTPTVEEIYARYTSVIGGNEKIKNIENYFNVTLITSEYSSTGEYGSQGSQKQGIINCWDYVNAQSATITKQFPSELTGDKITFTRILNANGKTTMLLPDGKKHEMTSLYTGFEENSFTETTVPSGAKLLPNEIFNGKKVYVIGYEKTTLGTQFNCTAYFDIESGFLVGNRLISEKETYGSIINTTSLSVYEEYKKVNDLLISHKVKQTIESKVTGASNSLTATTMTIQTIATEFNIDMEDFKSGCFQNPEACFEKYEVYDKN